MIKVKRLKSQKNPKTRVQSISGLSKTRKKKNSIKLFPQQNNKIVQRVCVEIN
jgi:hypothetical protein